MIEKIISGGQTGADQGALDAAIAAGLPHGGWLPKGRRTESGPLPAKYHLKEMPTSAYPQRTARNVSEADGTVILSHGALRGGSRLTLVLAQRRQKPVLHLDLTRLAAFAAARQLADWVRDNRVRVLNVAGSRASEDPYIYQKTKDIVETVLLLDQISSSPSPQVQRPRQTLPPPPAAPATLAGAVDLLERQMTLKDKATLANMTAAELDLLKPTLGRHIQEKFGLDEGNEALLNACRFSSGKTRITATQAVDVIIAALWERLRHSHRLRRIK